MFGQASSTVDDSGYKVGATTSMGSRMRGGPSFGGKPMAGRSSFGGATISMGNRRPIIGENNPFESTSTIQGGLIRLLTPPLINLLPQPPRHHPRWHLLRVVCR